MSFIFRSDQTWYMCFNAWMTCLTVWFYCGSLLFAHFLLRHSSMMYAFTCTHTNHVHTNTQHTCVRACTHIVCVCMDACWCFKQGSKYQISGSYWFGGFHIGYRRSGNI